MKIEFYRHNVNETDIENVVKVLNSTFLTTGTVVDEFEKKFAKYLGCKYTVGVTSCTAALHLALLAYGVGPGDEVITTPMTFIATANAIIHTGGTPVFVDVEPDTGNIDADLIENAITPRTKAILPVHLYGQMCDMKKIREIADRHNLAVIEDSAHAVDASRDGIGPGQLGNTACFSFYATKIITSGEGGAVSTNDAAVAENLKKLRLHGMSKGAADRYVKKYEHWDMEILGWKYNMDNIHAALLLDQLERLEPQWQRRDNICRMYEEAFHDVPGITCLTIFPDSKSSRLLFTILVPAERRDAILSQLQDKGIGVAINFRAIHLLTYYRSTYGYKRGSFPQAERIGDSTISLPLYTKLTDEEVEYIIAQVKGITSNTGKM
jgi:dTDP-4-amino-4,6-dideoxygalactose transaminase